MTQDRSYIRIFLCGDVMTGRGIDQLLPYKSKPHLYESYVKDARDYVALGERVNGKIDQPVPLDYIWGEALNYWHKLQPDVKIINLETAITESEEPWPNKGIHYRMHPLNVDVLKPCADICALANNHLLDWGYNGLTQTLHALRAGGFLLCGAGETISQAQQPAIFEFANNRILIFSVGMESSGVPSSWSATANRAGVYFIDENWSRSITSIAGNIRKYKQPQDLIIFSVHWGSNWGYEIPHSLRFFAQNLIDEAGVDVVYGHSSHHPRSLELYHNKLILYGCGDFINDYEGITSYSEYRGDLTLMYFLDFDRSTLQLIKITLIPLQIKNFRLHEALANDRKWLLTKLNKISSPTLEFILENDEMIYYH